MKRLFSIILIIVLMLSGCSTASDNSSYSNTIINNDNNNSKEIADKDYLYLTSNYSDGVSWLKYCDASAKEKSKEGIHSKYGCIDKNGELLFYFDATIITGEPSNFSNGYSYIESNSGEKLTVIDTTGNICSTYNLVSESYDGFTTTKSGNLDNYCVAYGDGYEVVQTHESSFDNNAYTYTVYDANNNQVYQLSQKPQNEIAVKYWGHGVFSFKNTGFYYAYSNVWVDDEYAKPDGEFNWDMRFSDVEYGDSFKDGDNWDYDVYLEYIDDLGNSISTKVLSRKKLGWNIISTNVYNNRCIIYGYPNDGKISKMYIYNFEDDSIVQLTDERYLNQLSEDFKYYFMDNRIVLTMKGQDSKRYYCMFDFEWNVIAEPKEFSYIDVSAKRIIRDFKEVYDENGSLLFEIDDNYVHSITGAEYSVFSPPTFQDDVLVVQTALDDRYNGIFLGSLGFAVYDLNGEILFNELSMSNANELEI